MDALPAGSPSIAVLVVLAFLVGFPALWVSITGAVAVLGGWTALASRFPGAERVEGVGKSVVSADLGRPWLPPVSYKGCLYLTVTPTGFGLVPMLLFRLFHPPLWIAWADVADIAETKALLVFPGARITFRDAAPVLRVWGSAGRMLRDQFAQSRAGGARR
jgi:hypothetical protein